MKFCFLTLYFFFHKLRDFFIILVFHHQYKILTLFGVSFFEDCLHSEQRNPGENSETWRSMSRFNKKRSIFIHLLAEVWPVSLFFISHQSQFSSVSFASPSATVPSKLNICTLLLVILPMTEPRPHVYLILVIQPHFQSRDSRRSCSSSCHCWGSVGIRV